MKKIFLFSTAILIALTLPAQDSSEFKRNEVGINIAPVLIGLLGAESNDPILSLNYKRHYEKSALRVTGNYSYQTFTNWNSPASYIDWADSVYYSNYHFNSRDETSILLGYERKIHQKDIEFFVGSDMGVGYSWVLHENYVDTLSLDAANGASFQQSFYRSGRPYSENTIETIQLIVSPFFGARYFISPRFSISSETKIFLHYNVFSHSKFYKEGKLQQEVFSYSSGFQINLPSLISNLSVNFYF